MNTIHVSKQLNMAVFVRSTDSSVVRSKIKNMIYIFKSILLLGSLDIHLYVGVNACFVERFVVS